jgi:UDP-glucose 4-epimerase
VIDDLSTGRREFVHERAQLVEHDIRRPFSVDADVVYHLAAQADVGTSMERPGFDSEVNVVGTVNTLEAAREAGAQLVFASTGGAIYGEVERPAGEDDPRRPVSAYGIAKLAAEAYVEGWNRIHGTSHAVLRFANVYGPRQSAALEGGVVSIFMDRLARGEETLVFGDGEQSRDYVYVGDVVDAVLAATGRGGVYNVGTGIETTVNELHRLCAEVVGSTREPRHVEARTGDARRSVLDPARTARELGWSAGTPLGEGLRLTWDSLR